MSKDKTPPVYYPDSPLISYSELERFGIRISRKRLRILYRAGRFPKPLELSPGRIAWRRSEIEQHLATLSQRP
jgi:predicted DNA-binding transcriptional regulator AlpA